MSKRSSSATACCSLLCPLPSAEARALTNNEITRLNKVKVFLVDDDKLSAYVAVRDVTTCLATAIMLTVADSVAVIRL